MSENSRLKKFEGYPHAIENGIEYNGDYVEGGEIGITFPSSPDAEFIVRKESLNKVRLEKLDKLREKRVGDPVSDRSFYMQAEEVVQSEMSDLLAEGIDPLAGGQETFAQGGARRKYAQGGYNGRYSIPDIMEDPTAERVSYTGMPTADLTQLPTEDLSGAPAIPAGSERSASTGIGDNSPQGHPGSVSSVAGYAKAAGALGQGLSGLAPNDPYAAEGVGQKDAGMQAGEASVDAVASAIPFVGQFYGAGKGISSGFEAGRDAARADDNKEGAEVAAYFGGMADPMGSTFDIAADHKSGAISTGDAIGANFLNLIAFGGIGGVGDAALEKKRRAFVERGANKEMIATLGRERAAAGTSYNTPKGIQNRVAPKINVPRSVGTGGVRHMANGGARSFAPGGVNYTDPTDPNDPWSTDFNTAPINPQALEWDQEALQEYLQAVNAERPGGVGAEKGGSPSQPKVDYAWPFMEILDKEDPVSIEDDPYVISEKDSDQLYFEQNVSGNYDNPDKRPKDPKDPKDPKKAKTDNTGKYIQSGIGALAQIAPNLAYLFGEGKDYDRVSYPKYSPKHMSGLVPLREARDSYASAREAMRQQGRLDLGALSALATQEAGSRSGIREQIQNANVGIDNQASQYNIGNEIQAQQATAANKGQYQTNKFAAMQGIGQGVSSVLNEGQKIDNDTMVKMMFAKIFGKTK